MAPAFSTMLSSSYSSWTQTPLVAGLVDAVSFSSTDSWSQRLVKVAVPSLLSLAAVYAIYSRVASHNQHSSYTSSSGSLCPLRGPTPFPVLGNVPQLDTSCIAQSIDELARKYGRLFLLHLPDPFVVVAHPEVLQQIYSSDWFAFDREVKSTEIFHKLAGLLVIMFQSSFIAMFIFAA